MSSVFYILLKKIPEGVNELYFVLGIIGGFLFIKDHLERKKRPFVLFIVIMMLSWRLSVNIVSSRYAIVFLIPFTVFSGYFICKAEKYNKRWKYYILFPATALFLFLILKKDLTVNRSDRIYYDISEIVCHIHDKPQRELLFMDTKDYIRVFYLSNKLNSVTGLSITLDEVCDFLNEHKNKSFVSSVLVRTKEEEYRQYHKKDTCECMLFAKFYINKSKKNRFLLFSNKNNVDLVK